MLVGETPGDREDLEGEPFVGPAGGLLRKALAAAGIDASDAYPAGSDRRPRRDAAWSPTSASWPKR